jgi:tetratricopeptide (TPR) repeat protein
MAFLLCFDGFVAETSYTDLVSRALLFCAHPSADPRFSERCAFMSTRSQAHKVILPGFVAIVVLMIAAYSRNGSWSNPVSLWHDAAMKSPNKARTNYKAGLAYGQIGDKEKAHGFMTRANQLDATFFNKALAKPEIFRLQGDLDAAIKEYQAQLIINPNQSHVHNALGTAYYEQGLLMEAAREFQEAIRLSPLSSVAHCNLGLVYYDRKLVADSIRLFREAIFLDPQDAEPHARLGIVYVSIGMMDEAISEFRSAIKINPEFVRFKELLNDTIMLKEKHTVRK